MAKKIGLLKRICKKEYFLCTLALINIFLIIAMVLAVPLGVAVIVIKLDGLLAFGLSIGWVALAIGVGVWAREALAGIAIFIYLVGLKPSWRGPESPPDWVITALGLIKIALIIALVLAGPLGAVVIVMKLDGLLAFGLSVGWVILTMWLLYLFVRSIDIGPT